MTRGFAKQLGRGLTFAAALVGAVALTLPTPSQARVSDGAAVGIGLGSFALGTAVGASAARPYYPAYPYYAAPPPAYYPPPAPAYYPARSCWDPYRGVYYAC